MKLEITSERVLQAASKCSQAKETLKILFPEAFTEAATHKIGDRFIRSGSEYILCGFSNMATLWSLSTGGAWSDSVRVQDLTAITKEEFDDILGSGVYRVEFLKTTK